MPLIQKYSGAVGDKAVEEIRELLNDARNFSHRIVVYLPNREMLVSQPLSRNSTEECCCEVF